MSIIVVLAHPEPGSFNHAIAARAVDTLTKIRRQFVFHDLYEESFNPVLPAAEQIVTACFAREE